MIDLLVTHAIAFAAGVAFCDAMRSWMVLRGWPRPLEAPRAQLARRQRRNLTAMKADIGPALNRPSWSRDVPMPDRPNRRLA